LGPVWGPFGCPLAGFRVWFTEVEVGDHGRSKQAGSVGQPADYLKVAHWGFQPKWGVWECVLYGAVLRRGCAVFCVGLAEAVRVVDISTLTHQLIAISVREIAPRGDFGRPWTVRTRREAKRRGAAGLARRTASPTHFPSVVLRELLRTETVTRRSGSGPLCM